MGDKQGEQGRQDSIRGLVQDLSEVLNKRAAKLREGTEFGHARPSEARLFMAISRNPRGLTDLATALNISRQAAHKTMQRLVKAGVVEFELVEGSKRDMIATITERGRRARALGRANAMQIEQEIAAELGSKDTDALRQLLTRLLAMDH